MSGFLLDVFEEIEFMWLQEDGELQEGECIFDYTNESI